MTVSMAGDLGAFWILVGLCALGAPAVASAQTTDRGQISGLLTDTAGNPIAACASAQTASEGMGVGTVRTDANGEYTLSLPPGTYYVLFGDCGPGETTFVSEYFNDKQPGEPRDAITVTAGQTTRADAQLARMGVITGRVTNQAGAPVADAEVRARGGPLGPRTATTDAEGLYDLRVRPGVWRVAFIAEGYDLEYFNDKPPTRDPDTAGDPVTVGDGQTLSGIDARLAPETSDEIEDPPPTVTTTVPARQSLSTALRTGFTARVGCSERCTVTSQLLLDSRTARRIGVAARLVVIARGRRTLARAGRAQITVRFTRRAARALRQTRRVTVRLRTTAVDATGNRTVQTKRKIVLAR